MRNLDEDIRVLERRIARERSGLTLLSVEWATTARDAVVSGKSLFAVAAVGFVLGDALRPKPSGRAAKLGLGGMLAGIAFSMLRARYGSPWVLADLALRAWRSGASGRERHGLADAPVVVPNPAPRGGRRDTQ